MGGVLAKPLIDQTALVDVPQAEGQQLVSQIEKSESFKELLKSHKIDNNKVIIKQLPESYGSCIAVRIPIKDNTGYDYSSYTVFFDKEKNFKESALFTFNMNDDGMYHFIAVTSNSKIEADISEDGKIISGKKLVNNVEQDLVSIFPSMNQQGTVNKITSELLTIKTALASGFWSCFNSCLASQGVAAWAIAALAILCGSCEWTGVTCILCLTAVKIGFVSEISYCLGQC